MLFLASGLSTSSSMVKELKATRWALGTSLTLCVKFSLYSSYTSFQALLHLPTASIILYFSFLCGFDSTKTFFSKSMKLFCKCPSTCTLRFRLLFLENSFPRLWCHSLDSIGKITALVFFSLTLHSELLLT